jgi:hypothetical protein
VTPLPDGHGEAIEIGSVTGRDAQAAAKAALELRPFLPSVPELPRKDPREGILVRDLGPLARIVEPATLRTTRPAGDAALVRDLEEADPATGPESEGLTAFFEALSTRKPVPPRVKVAVAGPVLLAARLTDAAGRSLATVPAAAEAVARYVVRRAVDLASRLAAFGSVVVVQLDEPGTTDGLDTASFWRLSSVVGEIRMAGHLAGIHDCGARDGRKLLLIGPDLVSVDAWGAAVPFEAHGEALGGYLRGGGTVAWGVLPTSGVLPDPRRVARGVLDRMGAVAGDRDVVRRRGLVSPSCGFGASTLEFERRARAALGIARAAWR